MRNLGSGTAPRHSGARVSLFAHRTWISAAGLVAILSASPVFGASKVVAVGDASPIGGTFAALAGISPLLLGTNDRGDVLFWSGVTGGSRPDGVFLFSNGAFTKIVAENDPSPIGGTFDEMSASTFGYRLNNRGDVAFLANVVGGSSGFGLFLFAGGTLSKVVAWGDLAPNPPLIDPITDPDIFVPVSGFSIDLNDNGEIVFFAMQGKPAGPSYVSRGGIYLSAGGAAPTRILTSGIDTEIGRLTITPGTVLGPFANNNREFVLWASTDQTTEAIFLCAAGACRKVVAVGDAIPGGTWGSHLGPCCIVGFNDSGQVGLTGLAPRGEVLIWAGGVFQRDIGPTYPVIEPRPGVLDRLFGTQSADLHPINKYGEIALSGATDEPGTSAYGIFTLSDTTLRKPVSGDDPAPTQGSFTGFGKVTLNNEACIAFEANTTGPSGFYYSLWQSDSQAVTKEKARKFFKDLDDHTIYARDGRGDVLLRQIYGDLSTLELASKVALDFYNAFGAYALKSLRVRILDANGRVVPDADRTELIDRRNTLRDNGVIRRLSTLQLELLKRHFKKCDGQIDFGKFKRALELFANGEIRTGAEGQREMNEMTQWVIWFEFAETAIAVGQDTDPWEKVLPSLVVGLEIYRRVYPAPPLPPDADPATKFLGELRRSAASRFDATQQLTDPQKRDLRNEIEALSLPDLRNRLRTRIGEMTVALQDPLPRTVQFASATADPASDGFNVAVRVRVTDGGVPVTDASVRLFVSELGVALPAGSFTLTTTASSAGNGEYTASFFVPSPPIGVSMEAYENTSLAAEVLSMLLNGLPTGAAKRASADKMR